MSSGDTSRGYDEWALSEDAEPVFRTAVELDVTFWDTANFYHDGTSDEIVGRAIRKYSRRQVHQPHDVTRPKSDSAIFSYIDVW